MKRPREFGPVPHVRYHPELSECPRHAFFEPSMSAQTLERVEHVTSLGFRCRNLGCRFPRAVYRSAHAEGRQVKGSGYGLDVVAHIGALRFGQHRTREEIWRGSVAAERAVYSPACDKWERCRCYFAGPRRWTGLPLLQPLEAGGQVK